MQPHVWHFLICEEGDDERWPPSRVCERLEAEGWTIHTISVNGLNRFAIFAYREKPQD